MSNTTTTVQITNRWTRDIIFECDLPDSVPSVLYMRHVIEKAMQIGADLRDADLHGADLRGADLRGAYFHGAYLHGANLHGADLHGADLSDANLSDANLHGANLHGANLHGADLRGANLHGANLHGANLHGANLHGANLHGADLSGANLSDADLHGANLHGAYLHGADLSGADLSGEQVVTFRDDIWAVLSSAPPEAQAVLAALHEGKVDGSTYSGECACLVGTIANARHCDYEAIHGLTPNGSRPAETWFMQIKPGQTPENHRPCAMAAQWVSEWIANMQSAFGQKEST